ncbi:MAG TPA: hypothetical protein DCY64_11790 [Hydrogenophaga sp.]|uniref:hypothetical protein n=1 Tax=Hydrogenophaga sp. TaxID=1904254 RepID=UPI0008BC753B|nr:hypothetical protein [Hydrogenophaga sp.]OGA75971.1 MAG: hypothetical protein A2X73_18425 [Burkholderiales bacterium GWE1_65_30]OGA89879.1 MAG: hypothetical protein A2X72_12555 [Burkholderiales bacterium GWF1_66_17]HAX20950.1 hypothetical protein [Hydrogenophaga sp.]
MLTEHEFIGDVKLYTTYNIGDQPAQGALPLIAIFGPAGEWMIKRHHFGTGGRFEIPGEDVVISLRFDAAGQHDATQGSIQIDMSCLFDLPLLDSKLKIKLDHQSYQLGNHKVSGAPIDSATGRIRLAGSGKFSAGMLGGHDCLIEVAGMFNPNPWT